MLEIRTCGRCRYRDSGSKSYGETSRRTSVDIVVVKVGSVFAVQDRLSWVLLAAVTDRPAT